MEIGLWRLQMSSLEKQTRFLAYIDWVFNSVQGKLEPDRRGDLYQQPLELNNSGPPPGL